MIPSGSGGLLSNRVEWDLSKKRRHTAAKRAASRAPKTVVLVVRVQFCGFALRFIEITKGIYYSAKVTRPGAVEGLSSECTRGSAQPKNLVRIVRFVCCGPQFLN